ncbi:MAG: response regulator transcription factor [Clostridia bacterium]|nr:response regulator transcription factor [Clostridia bacterium]
MYTILTVDDDEYINDLLYDALKRENYRVLRAFSGTEALLLLESETPDLILLDLMLPGISGEELIKKIHGIPVIVVSAKIDVDSKVNMLLGGAADYVTKPFELKELMARIRLRLKYDGMSRESGTITCGELTFDKKSYKVSLNGNELKLTKTELAILKVLMLNAPNVVTKSAILDKISLETPDCVEDSLKVHISNIRKKLREYSDREYIENIWGIGFKLIQS